MTLSLQDAVEQLRKDLQAAAAQTPGDGLHFVVEEAEIELQVVTERSGDTGAKVKLASPGDRRQGPPEQRYNPPGQVEAFSCLARQGRQTYAACHS